MTKAAIYARTATADEMWSSISIHRQVKTCQDTCSKNGWEVVGTFCDEGFSGNKGEMPSLLKMLQLAQDGDLQRVVVDNADRLTRNFHRFVEIQSELKKHGVDLVTVENQGLSVMLMEAVTRLVSQYEKATIPERRQRGKQAQKRRFHPVTAPAKVHAS